MGEDGYGNKHTVADDALQDRRNALVDKRKGAGGDPSAFCVVQVQRSAVAYRGAWAKRDTK